MFCAEEGPVLILTKHTSRVSSVLYLESLIGDTSIDYTIRGDPSWQPSRIMGLSRAVKDYSYERYIS